MIDATGKKLTKFSVVYHQPDYCNVCTPHELLFIKSVNEHKNDPAGLFIHRRFKEIDNPPMVVHWHSDIWPTKSQAILSAIKRQHEKLSDFFLKLAENG
jgi:hypothetical protein